MEQYLGSGGRVSCKLLSQQKSKHADVCKRGDQDGWRQFKDLLALLGQQHITGLLAGLTIQWILFPDSINDDEAAAAQRRAAAEAAGPQLPKLSVTSKPDELRRAFEVRSFQLNCCWEGSFCPSHASCLLCAFAVDHEATRSVHVLHVRIF